MKKILGIGGIFFRAQDPEALKKWYAEVLGLDLTDSVWLQEAGPTVFEPFPMDSAYFPSEKQWMLDIRVSDLEMVMAELKAKGVEVEVRDEWNTMPEIGKFARVHDPEGNPVELWEPA